VLCCRCRRSRHAREEGKGGKSNTSLGRRPTHATSLRPSSLPSGCPSSPAVASQGDFSYSDRAGNHRGSHSAWEATPKYTRAMRSRSTYDLPPPPVVCFRIAACLLVDAERLLTAAEQTDWTSKHEGGRQEKSSASLRGEAQTPMTPSMQYLWPLMHLRLRCLRLSVCARHRLAAAANWPHCPCASHHCTCPSMAHPTDAPIITMQCLLALLICT
jgi:hypothetical protein